MEKKWMIMIMPSLFFPFVQWILQNEFFYSFFLSAMLKYTNYRLISMKNFSQSFNEKSFWSLISFVHYLFFSLFNITNLSKITFQLLLIKLNKIQIYKIQSKSNFRIFYYNYWKFWYINSMSCFIIMVLNNFITIC